jgi:hypothetical protein
MPIRMRLEYDAQALIDIEQFAQDFGAVVFKLFKEIHAVIQPQMLAELRYTPARRPWEAKDFQSDAQRKAFFAKTGGKPYQRTGQYARGWSVTVKQTNDGGQIVVTNSTPYGKFVGGSFARSGKDFQQRGHKRTGWPRSSATADFWIEAAQEDFERRLAKYVDESIGTVSLGRRNR